MRIHRAFGELAFAAGADDALGTLVRAEHLRAIRFEPVVRLGKGSAVVDLHFSDGERRVVVPFVLVDVAMLEARERDALVWPAFARDAGIIDEPIEARLEEWLGELRGARPLGEEHFEVFGGASEEAGFAAARAAGFLGAAPIEEVARRAAPFVFAKRHARGRDVAIAAPDAALGAKLLAPLARRVRIDRDDAEGIAWYRPALSGDCAAEVAIVDASGRGAAKDAAVIVDVDRGSGVAVEPAPIVPLVSLFDFTGTVRRGERAFSVTAHSAPPLSPALYDDAPAIGGSEGRILFGLRGGALRTGGADVDLARTLASAMRDEGFTVELTDDPRFAGEFGPDLIHAFGLADAAAAATYMRAAIGLQIPFALHALYDAPAFGGYWGATVAPYCYRFVHDEVGAENLLGLMAQRRLAINEIRPEAPYHPNPRWHVDVRAILDGCDAIFVEGSAEEDALAPLGVEPSKLAAVPTPVPAPPQVRAELVGALCGSEGFVLLHAPIEPTQNQLQAVRAAQRADLPLVVCGPVIDAEYLSLVREFAGDRTVVVAEPDEGTLEALYRSAEVFLDAAWVGCGLSRAVRAVSRGAALALSNRLPVADLQMGEFARTVDPGDVAALARGLGDAWYARRNEPERFEQARLEGVARRGVRQVTRSIVLAYAQALERRKAPVLR